LALLFVRAALAMMSRLTCSSAPPVEAQVEIEIKV
jgi:hypothetical protein